MIRIFLLLFLLLPAFGDAQIITTIAGSDTAGYNGDNIPATSGRLFRPYFTCLDRKGNILIADGENHRLRMINSSGIIRSIAGTGINGYNGDNIQATDAQLGNPFGVAIDAIGNIYLADQSPRIRKIDTTGIITTVAGNGIQGYSGDNGPATDAELYFPAGLALDIYGNIYFTEGFTNRVRRVNTLGIITTIAGGGTIEGDGISATNVVLYEPYGIVVDGAGNLYIAESYRHRVRKVDPLGIITTVAGINGSGSSGDNGPATLAKLGSPTGLAIDGAGNLYICDASDNKVRRVTTDGIINTVAGTGVPGFSGDGGLAINAQLRQPIGVSLDSAYNIYVCEFGNSRVRKIQSTVSVSEVFSQPLTIDVYPNPAILEVNISASIKVSKLKINNLFGISVFERSFNTNNLKVDISDFPAGVYFILINDTEVKKIVKK